MNVTSLPYTDDGEPYPVPHTHHVAPGPTATSVSEGVNGYHTHWFEDEDATRTATTDGHWHKLPTTNERNRPWS